MSDRLQCYYCGQDLLLGDFAAHYMNCRESFQCSFCSGQVPNRIEQVHRAHCSPNPAAKMLNFDKYLCNSCRAIVTESSTVHTDLLSHISTHEPQCALPPPSPSPPPSPPKFQPFCKCCNQPFTENGELYQLQCGHWLHAECYFYRLEKCCRK